MTLSSIPPGLTAGGAKAVSVAIHANPALWLLVALGVGSLLEAFALVLLYRASEPLRRKIAGTFSWAVHPFTGPDGRPSFSKIVDLLVIGAYWSGAPIPEGVAMLVIGSAHGTKVLLAIVEKLSLNVSSATNLARSVNDSRTSATNTNLNTNVNTNISDTTTRTIAERREPAQGFEATP